jgi:hypothetical protein
MSSESVYQVARSRVDVGSFHARLEVRSMIVHRDSPEYFGFSLVLLQAYNAYTSVTSGYLQCVFNGKGPRTLHAVRGIS